MVCRGRAVAQAQGRRTQAVQLHPAAVPEASVPIAHHGTPVPTGAIAAARLRARPAVPFRVAACEPRAGEAPAPPGPTAPVTLRRSRPAVEVAAAAVGLPPASDDLTRTCPARRATRAAVAALAPTRAVVLVPGAAGRQRVVAALEVGRPKQIPEARHSRTLRHPSRLH